MFSIAFEDEPIEYPYDDENCPAAPGLLVLGKTWEGFLANISVWDKDAYRTHWHTQLLSIVAGAPKAALIVSYNSPSNASSSEIWSCYRDGSWVRMQNRFLFYEGLDPAFDVTRINDYVDDYRATTEEGEKISEWMVSERDIEMFLYRPMTLRFTELSSLLP